MHRVLEGHREDEALPLLRVMVVFVLHGQGDGLSVDVFDGGDPVGGRRGS